MIVLSQPGPHLEPLQQAGARVAAIPGLDERELESLATRLNVVPGDQHKSPHAARPLLEGSEAIADFLDALVKRSAGNALYATYLCRETLRRADIIVDAATTVRNLPPFDGTLKNYYDHLYLALGAEAGWVADVIALVDFAITRAELRQIRPDAAPRVDGALAVLQPVLTERATQGGVRVYHESFARYLRGPFEHDTAALRALLEHIADWLDSKGLFTDPRAFRSLLAILAEAGHDKRVVDLVDLMFVTRAVAAGFPASSINAKLATAIGSAARLGNWAAVVRYVELARAAEWYQTERFDSTLVAFVDVPASLLGADTLAARLLDDDRLVMPARAGLQMCAAVDALGANAPWRAYVTGYLREAKTDNTSYGEASDRAVALAWLRGRLRVATRDHGIEPPDRSESTEAETEACTSAGEESEEEIDLTAPIEWSRLAHWVESLSLPMHEVISAVEDTHGLDGVIRLIHSFRSPGDACLALAERLAREPASDSSIGSPRLWATVAIAHGVSAGSMHRILRLGVDPAHLAHDTIAGDRERLLDLTRKVQEPSVRWESGHVGNWLDACTLAAHRDPLGLNVAESLVAGDGWYRCWLRFTIALSRAEAAEPENRGALALEALRFLTGDLDPFSGRPRSCDLYSLHGAIQNTISRTMGLLDDEQWELGLGILKNVSASVTTTVSGELDGPVSPNFLLRIAVDGASPSRRRAAEALVYGEVARGSANRFYADIAEYRLLAARLALTAGDRQRAEALWQEVCTFLTAYGWHKDITIYEVLDPLPMLIKADPARARDRVAAVQGLCKRVPLHTDGKETRHAWSQWWELLAKADPVAAVHLAVPQLLAECNSPNWFLNEALQDVWREWHQQADPLLSGILRLTLDAPLDASDVKQLAHLASDPRSADPAFRRLMAWLLARADERPVAYSYSNSAELIAKDDEEIAKLNSVAAAADLPLISKIGDGQARASDESRSDDDPSMPIPSAAVEDAFAPVAFPLGLPGLSRATRAWHSRPYNAHSPKWAVGRFANAIGYRLVELAADGRYQEAASAIRSLAEGSSLGEQSAILRSIAEGLERHGEVRLAAIAYALTWTCTRGHGGWLTFGGETEIEALHRATSLDSGITCAIVAEDVERVVGTSSRGTHGISQALIYAFSVGAMTWPGQLSIDVALAAWDEAFAVISARAPRVDAFDDPDHQYVPPDQDGGEAAPGDLQGALALAALGGLAHPSREKKRRAFLAAQLLLDERAAASANAFKIALGSISDPATLAWLLRLIELSDETGIPVRASCQETLRGLASHRFLTVRALARRLIAGEQPPIPPPSPADAALLGGSGNLLWTPSTRGASLAPDEPAGVNGLLVSVAGTRLHQGEQFLPGLSSAVRARVATLLSDSAVKKRLNSQLDTLADRLRKRWPDAFLAHQQTIEEALQSIATGGRAARIITGDPVSNPIAWEDELASAILDDPSIPLILEAHRQPRPCIPPPPGSDHMVWVQIRERTIGGSNSSIVDALEREGFLFATLSIELATSVSAVEHGTFRGWHWLGTVEKRTVKHPDRRHETNLVTKRYRVLEVRDTDCYQAMTLPPVAHGDLRWWRAQVNPALGAPLLGTSQPIVGEDRKLKMVGDGRSGLGVPDSLLVPTATLIALLKLRPGASCSYEDKNGPGLALVTWRAEYDTSEYYLAWPRTCGCGIVIRPDLLTRLADATGKDRLVQRDFVVGDLGLLSNRE